MFKDDLNINFYVLDVWQNNLKFDPKMNFKQESLIVSTENKVLLFHFPEIVLLVIYKKTCCNITAVVEI